MLRQGVGERTPEGDGPGGIAARRKVDRAGGGLREERHVALNEPVAVIPNRCEAIEQEIAGDLLGGQSQSQAARDGPPAGRALDEGPLDEGLGGSRAAGRRLAEVSEAEQNLAPSSGRSATASWRRRCSSKSLIDWMRATNSEGESPEAATCSRRPGFAPSVFTTAVAVCSGIWNGSRAR